MCFKTDLEDFAFKLYDINGDGEIGFPEFLVMMTIMTDGSPETKISQIFRLVSSSTSFSYTLYK